MSTILERAAAATKRRYNHWQWRLVGEPRYIHQESFLARPGVGEGPAQRVYEDGFTAVGERKEASRAILEAFQPIFGEAIRMAEEARRSDARFRHIDAQRRFWTIGPGVIRLAYEDRTHPLFREIFGEERTRRHEAERVATIQELLEENEPIGGLVQDPLMRELAALGNAGDTRPLLIQIERKVHHPNPSPYSIHVDSPRATFKGYVYLTDVLSEADGPLWISRGSHHWKLYPRVLREVFANRRKDFTREDFARFGIEAMEPILAKAGSLLAFCSNAVHTASDVAPGKERWTLQFYYYGPRLWSTDKTSSRQGRQGASHA